MTALLTAQVAGCGGAQAVDPASARTFSVESATPTFSAPASVPPTTSAPAVEPSPSADVRVVTVGDPITAAKLWLMELGGSPCLYSKELDLALEQLELDGKAARLGGSSGVLEAGHPGIPESGDAYLGPALDAASAFGASELYKMVDGSGAVIIIATARAIPGAKDGAPVGYRLRSAQLADGRAAQVLTDMFTTVPCPGSLQHGDRAATDRLVGSASDATSG